MLTTFAALIFAALIFAVQIFMVLTSVVQTSKTLIYAGPIFVVQTFAMLTFVVQIFMGLAFVVLTLKALTSGEWTFAVPMAALDGRRLSGMTNADRCRAWRAANPGKVKDYAFRYRYANSVNVAKYREANLRR